MNKLRQSFRRKKDVYVPESSRPHQWQTDEEAVRGGKCSFAVKRWQLVEPLLRQQDICLAITAFTAGSKVKMEPCNMKEPRQKWKQKGPTLQHMVSGLCLDSQLSVGPPAITQCWPQLASQVWEPQLIT